MLKLLKRKALKTKLKQKQKDNQHQLQHQHRVPLSKLLPHPHHLLIQTTILAMMNPKVLLKLNMLPLMVVVMVVLTAVVAAVINPRKLSSKRANRKVLSLMHLLLPLSLAAPMLATKSLIHPRPLLSVQLMYTLEDFDKFYFLNYVSNN